MPLAQHPIPEAQGIRSIGHGAKAQTQNPMSTQYGTLLALLVDYAMKKNNWILKWVLRVVNGIIWNADVTWHESMTEIAVKQQNIQN